MLARKIWTRTCWLDLAVSVYQDELDAFVLFGIEESKDNKTNKQTENSAGSYTLDEGVIRTG